MEEPSLGIAGDVHIHDILALKAMVLHMISLEGDSGRNTHGEICKNAIDLVPEYALGCEAVAGLVHCEGEAVVDGSREGVAAEEPGVPGSSLEEVKGK